MSKCDEVLDNWEEIDDAGLSSQLNQLKKEIKPEAETMSFQNGGGIPLMMVMRPDEQYGANYTESAKPTVKILRRPTQQSTETKANESRPKLPIKSLQQREQEYAEARLRILGAAKNPEDELDTSMSSPSGSGGAPKVVSKGAGGAQYQSPPPHSLGTGTPLSPYSFEMPKENYNNFYYHPAAMRTPFEMNGAMNGSIVPGNNLMMMNVADYSGTGNGGVNSTTSSNSATIYNSMIRPYDNILRMPRGPDGTSGFNFRR